MPRKAHEGLNKGRPVSVRFSEREILVLDKLVIAKAQATGKYCSRSALIKTVVIEHLFNDDLVNMIEFLQTESMQDFMQYVDVDKASDLFENMLNELLPPEAIKILESMPDDSFVKLPEKSG